LDGQAKKTTDHENALEALDKEMTESIRPLPKAFKDLEEFKRKTMAFLMESTKDHSDRITKLEVDLRVLDTNNKKDH